LRADVLIGSVNPALEYAEETFNRIRGHDAACVFFLVVIYGFVFKTM